MFLAKLDVAYVVCGHSERRELFGETDEMVAAKVTAIQRHGMTPIVCVGETLEEREQGGTTDKVIGQLDAVVAGRATTQIAAMVIAYEPIWAIGTGRTATAADAQAVCAAIRERVGHVTDPATAAGRADPVRRFGELGEHRRADGRSPTSTAPSSAGPASTPTSSPRSWPTPSGRSSTGPRRRAMLQLCDR